MSRQRTSRPRLHAGYCEVSNDDFTRLLKDHNKLREVAQAVVDRWDTPLWKDVPATAEYIAALRKELAE